MSKNYLIFAVLAVALAVGSTLFSGKKTTTDPRIGKAIKSGVYAEDFDEMEIYDFSKKTRLKKIDGTWSIVEKDNYPADLEKITEIVEKINTVELAFHVSKKKAEQKELKLLYKEEEGAGEDNTGVAIKLTKGGDPVFSFVVGDSRTARNSRQGFGGPSGGTYARVENESVSYLVKESLYFDTDPRDWIPRDLFKVKSDEIKKVVVSGNKEPLTLSRDKKDAPIQPAKLKKTEKFIESEADSYFDDFNPVSIDDVKAVESGKSANLKSPVSVAVHLFDETILTLRIGTERVGDSKDRLLSVFARKASGLDDKWLKLNETFSKYVYVIDDWQADRWAKKRSDFLKKSDK